MSKETRHFYEFGSFRVDPARRLLLQDGKPVPLTPKVFETLLVLVQSSGKVLGKDELMNKLWPDSFVEEANLTQSVFVLRKALGETPSEHRYIVTVPGRGYRFAAEVRQVPDESIELVLESHTTTRVEVEQIEELDNNRKHEELAGAVARGLQVVEAPPIPSHGERLLEPSREGKLLALRDRVPRIGWPVALAAGLVIAGTVSSWLLLSPLPPPKVLQVSRITHFGRVAPGLKLATDGVRLYFAEKTGGHWDLAHVATEGGEPVAIPTPFPNTTLLDISPGGAELLVSSFIGMEEEQPLWVLPVAGGSPRRLGELSAADAAWSPDGSKIVYARGQALYVADGDGSNSRKLVSVGGEPLHPRWSPTGRTLRFTLISPKTGATSLWEVSAEGTGLHPLFPGWKPGTEWAEGECCGNWTPDGKYFLFRSYRQRTFTLWALCEKQSFFRRTSRGPVQLYAGPLSFLSPLPDPSGKKLFLVGWEESRELVRYDSALRQFVPFLSGVPARLVSFSRDGRWVAYMDVNDGTLWRRRADGCEQLQLTFPPMTVWQSQWSPDGRQIVFDATRPDRQSKLYRISPDGGNPEEVIPGESQESSPTWSPDGSLLLFQRGVRSATTSTGTTSICALDLRTHQISILPSSGDLGEPEWSPDGRYVVAHRDGRELMLFDFRTRQWTQLASVHGVHGLYWSHDSRYVYFQDMFEGADQPIYRVSITDRVVQRLATLKQFPRADVTGYALTGLAPDDSPLATLNRSNSDIYALDVDLP